MKKLSLALLLVVSPTISSYAFSPSDIDFARPWQSLGKFEKALGIPQNWLRVPTALAATGVTLYAGYQGVVYILQKIEDAQPTLYIINKAQTNITTQQDNFAASKALVKELETTTDLLKKVGIKEAFKDLILGFDNYSNYPFVYFVQDLNRAIKTLSNTSFMLNRRISLLSAEEKRYEKELSALGNQAHVLERELRNVRTLVMSFNEYKNEQRYYDLVQKVQFQYNVHV